MYYNYIGELYKSAILNYFNRIHSKHIPIEYSILYCRYL